MAFEDGLGQEPSKSIEHDQEFRISSSGLVSRTLDLWFRKFIHYIIIVGIPGAAVLLVSAIVLFVTLGITDVISQDLFNYIIGLFTLTSLPDSTLITITILFAIVLLIVNAFVSGAAVKFTLDEYGFQNGDIRTSFSYSFRRFVSIIIFQSIISFMVAIVLVPSASLSATALDMIDISDPFNPVFPPGSVELLVGSFLLMFGGGLFMIYFQVRLTPTLAILMDTKFSLVDSLKKSWRITSGNFFHIFVAQILLFIAIFVINILLSFIGEFLFGYDTPYALILGVVLSSILVVSLNYIFGVVLYRDLISRTDIDDLPGFIM